MTAADREAVRRQRHHARAAADRRHRRAGPAVPLEPVRRGSDQRPRPVPRPRAHRAAGAARAGRRGAALRRAHRAARDEGDVGQPRARPRAAALAARAGATWPLGSARTLWIMTERTRASGLEAAGPSRPPASLPLEAAGLGLVIEDRVARCCRFRL
ncbi:MAG: hypothetical protein M0C28_16655 [Candidatus Moduliflexus flocculans]|nr:hypothetical protein [Candidatus Moduliflexus flocculans]